MTAIAQTSQQMSASDRFCKHAVICFSAALVGKSVFGLVAAFWDPQLVQTAHIYGAIIGFCFGTHLRPSSST